MNVWFVRSKSPPSKSSTNESCPTCRSKTRERAKPLDSFVIRNGDDSTNKFNLKGITTNNGLSSASFKFKPPKDYMVIKE